LPAALILRRRACGKGFILGAVAGSGIRDPARLVAAALAVVLLILYIVRATVVLILIAGAPLLDHTRAAQTDGLRVCGGAA
jgi:hypothetical protein